MTISSIQQSDYFSSPAIPEDIKRDIVKEENTNSTNRSFSGLQKELSQILANVQPPQSVIETSKRQLQSGKLDVKI